MYPQEDKPGAHEAFARSSSHKESAPVSREDVDTESCIDQVVNDVRSKFQYVLVENKSSGTCSPSNSSEWSYEYLETDLAGHHDEALPNPSNTASQEPFEEHATTSTKHLRYKRPDRESFGLKLFSRHLAQRMPASLYPHNVVQQTQTLDLTTINSFHGLPGDNVEASRTAIFSKGTQGATTETKVSTALDQKCQDDKCKQDKKGKQKQVLVATSETASFRYSNRGTAIKDLIRNERGAVVDKSDWRFHPDSRPTARNGDESACESNQIEIKMFDNTKPGNKLPEDFDEEGPMIIMVPVSSIQRKARRLTRRCQIRRATIFDRAATTLITPEEHFAARNMRGSIPHSSRYVSRWNDREILLVTDGSCAFPGSLDGIKDSADCEPSAGASFIYRPNSGDPHVPSPTSMPFRVIDQARSVSDPVSDVPLRRLILHDPTGRIALRLEAQGPRGDLQKHTSNRAKLRAVIAALDFRPWHAEGWKRVVVSTDLEYIALGATQWISLWAKRKWRSAPRWTKEGKMLLGKKIANRDLWEELQNRIDILHECGTEVSFWLISPSMDSPLLREAKAAAREAARLKSDTLVVEEYTKLLGIGM